MENQGELELKEIPTDYELELRLAAADGNLERVKFCVAFLKRYEGNIDAYGHTTGKTALHRAIEGHHSKVTRYLLSQGANPTIRDGSGKTPFDYLSFHQIQFQCNTDQDSEITAVIDINNLNQSSLSQKNIQKIDVNNNDENQLISLDIVEETHTGLDSNTVIIRIWRGSPGHVSLETSKHYISFWPKGVVNKAKMFKEVTGKLQTYIEDKIREERPEDESIELSSLNVDAINKAFEKFKSSNFKWSLLASSVFKETEAIKNCSGLVAHLLLAGGVNAKLIRRFGSLSRELTESCYQSTFMSRFICELIIESGLLGVTSTSDKEDRNWGYYLLVSLSVIWSLILVIDVVRCTRQTYQGKVVTITPEGIWDIAMAIAAKEGKEDQPFLVKLFDY